MTLRRAADTKIYSADLRDRAMGRIHLSLRTTRKDEAEARLVALRALVREGDRALVGAVRRREINIQAVERCYRERRPFSELRAARDWPALGAAIEDYLQSIADNPNRAEGTAESAATSLRAAERFFGAEMPVGEIKAADEARYRAARIDAGDKPGTLRTKLARLDALYHWLIAGEARAAEDEGRQPRRLRSPVETLPIAEQTRVRFLSVAETALVFAAAPDSQKALVGLGILAGLRIGEALSLRLQDVDMERRQLHIGAHDGWRPKTPKSVRMVPVADSLHLILASHIARDGNSGWLFPAASGRTWMSNLAGYKHTQVIVERAGLVYGQGEPMGVTFHTFRHTFASHLVMAGVDLYTVSKFLGHSSTKEAEETYAHLSPDYQRAAIQRLDKGLSAAFTGGGE